uniref:PDZ domain-containing protein n=1 Tax=Heligmosomoides polygyrus TaxID=6339 RepID=A0A183GJ06_HELPZ
LIEVNGDSLLGCDQSEAAAILRSSNELRILVCDGYNVSHAPRIDDRGITSSKPSRIPPAVAPKPTLRNSQLQNVPSVVETANPEKLTFASKVKNFEREIEVQKLATKQASASSLPSPAMKPLITDNDVLKLKEDEGRRRLVPCREPITPEEFGDGFEKMLDECVKSRIVTHPRKIESFAAAPNLISNDLPLNDVEKR